MWPPFNRNMIKAHHPPGIVVVNKLDVARKDHCRGRVKRLSDLIGWPSIPGQGIEIRSLVLKHHDDAFRALGANAYDGQIIVKVSGLGISGFGVYKTLFDTYHIQTELAGTHIILCVLS